MHLLKQHKEGKPPYQGYRTKVTTILASDKDLEDRKSHQQSSKITRRSSREGRKSRLLEDLQRRKESLCSCT